MDSTDKMSGLEINDVDSDAEFTIEQCVQRLQDSLANVADTEVLEHHVIPMLNKLLSNISEKQNVGADEIANAGAVPILVEYMKSLSQESTKYPQRGKEFRSFDLVRDVFWNASDKSERFCNECRKCGLFELLVKDLKNLQTTFQKNLETQGSLVMQAMIILLNCARFTENSQRLIQLNIADLIKWFAENTQESYIHGDKYLHIVSAVLLTYVVGEEEQLMNDMFVVNILILQKLDKLLSNSLKQPNHRWEGFSAEELLVNLRMLSNNRKNSIALLHVSQVLSSVSTVFQTGKDREVTAALQLLLKLLSTNENKEIIQSNSKLAENVRKIWSNPKIENLQILVSQVVSALEHDKASKIASLEDESQVIRPLKEMLELLQNIESTTVKHFVQTCLEDLKMFLDDMKEEGTVKQEAIKIIETLNVALFVPNETKERKKLVDEVVEAEGVPLFIQYMNFITDHQQKYPTEGKNLEFLEVLFTFCWNASNESVQFCETSAIQGMIELLTEYLKLLEPTFLADPNGQGYHVLQVINILWSFAKAKINREYFSKVDAFNLIKSYKEKSRKIQIRDSTTFPMVVTVLLACIADNENIDDIKADNNIFQYIAQDLNIALASDNHQFEGFSVEELVNSLHQLARNETNNVAILSEDILPSLQLILDKGKEREKIAAASLVCSLAGVKENKEKILEDDNTMTQLRQLAEDETSTNEEIQKHARAALFDLKKEEDKEDSNAVGSEVPLDGESVNTEGSSLERYKGLESKSTPQSEGGILNFPYSSVTKVYPSSLANVDDQQQKLPEIVGAIDPWFSFKSDPKEYVFEELKSKVDKNCLTKQAMYRRPPLAIDFSFQLIAYVSERGDGIEISDAFINIPPGALDPNTHRLFFFSLHYGKQRNMTPDFMVLTPTLECSPSMQFLKPVTIKLPTCCIPSDPNVMVTPQISHDGQTWLNLKQVEHGGDNVIKFEVDSFSWFRIAVKITQRFLFTKHFQFLCYRNRNDVTTTSLLWKIQDKVRVSKQENEEQRQNIGDAFRGTFSIPWGDDILLNIQSLIATVTPEERRVNNKVLFEEQTLHEPLFTCRRNEGTDNLEEQLFTYEIKNSSTGGVIREGEFKFPPIPPPTPVSQVHYETTNHIQDSHIDHIQP